MTKINLSKLIFIVLIGFLLTSYGQASIALILGIIFSIIFRNPFLNYTKKYTSDLLSYSVMGLGAGMNLITVLKVGAHGFFYTLFGISYTFIIAFILNRILKIKSETSLLITTGTAICGGSAIAAMSSAIAAATENISLSLAVVFLLNALALFVFPPIGHLFNFSETQFGIWSALSIHDTSSVVGASMQYGKTALNIATTIKLARALWIVPLVLLISYFYNKKNPNNNSTFKKPWFILGFIIFAALFSFIPVLSPFAKPIEVISKKGLILSLFFIGTNLSINTIKSLGPRPIVLAFSLWIIVAATNFLLIFYNIIQG